MTNKKITIADLAEVITLLVKRFDKFEQRLDKIEQRLSKIEQRLDKLEQRVGKLEQRVGKLEQRLDKIEQRVGTLEKSFNKLEETVDSLALITYKEFQKMGRRLESNEEKMTYMQRDIGELKYGQIEIKGMLKTKTDTKDFEAFKKKCEPLFS